MVLLGGQSEYYFKHTDIIVQPSIITAAEEGLGSELSNCFSNFAVESRCQQRLKCQLKLYVKLHTSTSM